MEINPNDELQAMRDELEMWQRRDVVIDFVCSVAIAGGLGFLFGCLL